jgi:hypothetical protein
MKYNIGDKVRVKSLDWYNENKSDEGHIFCRSRYFNPDMSTFCSCILTIKSINSNFIHVEENIFDWTEDMFEGLANYKENMDYIEITLNDKNYIIDVEKAKDLGILKEKDRRCKSWEEFKLKYKGTRGYYYDYATDKIYNPLDPWGASEQINQQDAIEIYAFSKLLKLRRDWIGEWNPDWSNVLCKCKYCIISRNNNITIGSFDDVQHIFSFPTEEMAREFLECFRSLFEQCKMLI